MKLNEMDDSEGEKLMKIVIAPSSFKGSACALEASLAIERGIKRVLPEVKTVLVPLLMAGKAEWIVW